MDLTEIIRKRKSCRTYLKKKLDSAVKAKLENYISENDRGFIGEPIHFKLIEKNLDEQNKMRLNYGMITNHNTYILGTSLNSPVARMNYGYLLEKIVIKATELGLATCWIGYFDPAYFTEIKIQEGYEIPSIIIVGYHSERLSFQDKFTRLTVSASKRNPWDQIFFFNSLKSPLTPEMSGNFKDVLEMVRLAPSSGNTQPWRIIWDTERNAYHFFKKVISVRYEEKGLHDVDMGICLAHFEMTAVHCKLSGHWSQFNRSEIISPDKLEYVISWSSN